MKFYEPNILVNEAPSSVKTESQNRFLDAVLATPVMAEVRRYLVGKKLASSNDDEFKEMLGHLWFSTFLRKKWVIRIPIGAFLLNIL